MFYTKEFVRDGLVHRKDYKVIPPKVEYSITEKGRSLVPLLDFMCAW
ncbi:winged helix-turn-helix transcriptional regulator [Mycoplasmatota bacterium]|nr:winged helix-turn-helix transcriptional regulator [Mycoplasmatota bacterium]